MEYFKCGLISHPNRSMEEFVNLNDFICAYLAQEVLVKTFIIWS